MVTSTSLTSYRVFIRAQNPHGMRESVEEVYCINVDMYTKGSELVLEVAWHACSM